MIKGLGIDIVEISRLEQVLERHPERFLEKTFTESERRLGEAKGPNRLAFYAGRWAAKEALAKALGTGFGEKCSWLDIQILNDPAGKPELSLLASTRKFQDELLVSDIHLSISHERHYACAVVILQ